MAISRGLFAVILIAAPSAYGQQSRASSKSSNLRQSRVVEATICEVVRRPWEYDNRIVKVRAAVQVSFEYSTLSDRKCDDSIWFTMADGSGLPGLVATVSPRETRPRPARRISVRLARGARFEQLQRYLEQNDKGDACTQRPPPLSGPPDCTTYRIEATFTGRIDGISRQLRAARRRRQSPGASDGRGYGHMGLFDAQLVIEEVEEVVALPK